VEKIHRDKAKDEEGEHLECLTSA